MAIIKCKMCGGDLNTQEGVSVAQCEYCGTQQTVPPKSDGKKLTLFARANRLRTACEFDKAAGVYESIVADFPEEAEAYWGLVLCRYGIEYVDDPRTGKKIPTCHRSSFDSVLDDGDFDQALENADVVARRIYREEAKMIETLRRGIVEVSGKEKPYDIFICYKETDENGDRTVDSVIAQDVYDALTGKGYRVFFSRVTLEEKLGIEYEPYIFAALNSARLMLVIGTDYEHFNAVWVKNEWNRFLMLMEAGKGKTLIPCYKGIDAYDMPKEFAKLQAQDMGKVGAMQDLLRGVDKIMGQSAAQDKQASVSAPADMAGPTVQSLMERARIFLEDGDFGNADRYFDRVLDIEPKNAEAYFGKFLARNRVRSAQGVIDRAAQLEITRALGRKEACPADEARIAALVERFTVPKYLPELKIREELRAYDRTFDTPLVYLQRLIEKQKAELDSTSEFTRAEQYATGDFAAYVAKIRQAIVEPEHLSAAIARAQAAEEEAIKSISEGYAEFLDRMEQSLAQEHEEALKARDENERKEEAARRRAAEIARQEQINQKILYVGICVAVIAAVLYFAVIKPRLLQAPREQYRKLISQGRYDEAIVAVEAVDDWEEGTDGQAAQYGQAETLLDAGDRARAAMAFAAAGDYKDARARCYALWNEMIDRRTVIIAGEYSSFSLGESAKAIVAAIEENGTVRSNQSGMEKWKNIVQLAITGGSSVSDQHFIGLTGDGRLVSTYSIFANSRLKGIDDVVAIASEGSYLTNIAVLRSNGTVRYYDSEKVKERENTSSMGDKKVIGISGNVGDYIDADGVPGYGDEGKRAVALDSCGYSTVFLNEDGTVTVHKSTTRGVTGTGLIKEWNEISAVRIDGVRGANGSAIVMGIHSDGRVLLSDGREYPPLPDIVMETLDLRVWNSNDIWIYGLNSDGDLMVYTLELLDRWTQGELTDEQAAYEARHLNKRGLDVSIWKGIRLPKTGSAA